MTEVMKVFTPKLFGLPEEHLSLFLYKILLGCENSSRLLFGSLEPTRKSWSIIYQVNRREKKKQREEATYDLWTYLTWNLLNLYNTLIWVSITMVASMIMDSYACEEFVPKITLKCLCIYLQVEHITLIWSQYVNTRCKLQLLNKFKCV